jgi:glycine/D-amino acid oxidase-like deaminating enzyme
MRLQARWVEAAEAAYDGRDFARRLENAGMFVRIDPSVEPLAFRGATVSPLEIVALRTIEHVVRARRVVSIGRTRVATDAGEIPAPRARSTSTAQPQAFVPPFLDRCSSPAASRSST